MFRYLLLLLYLFLSSAFASTTEQSAYNSCLSFKATHPDSWWGGTSRCDILTPGGGSIGASSGSYDVWVGTTQYVNQGAFSWDIACSSGTSWNDTSHTCATVSLSCLSNTHLSGVNCVYNSPPPIPTACPTNVQSFMYFDPISHLCKGTLLPPSPSCISPQINSVGWDGKESCISSANACLPPSILFNNVCQVIPAKVGQTNSDGSPIPITITSAADAAAAAANALASKNNAAASAASKQTASTAASADSSTASTVAASAASQYGSSSPQAIAAAQAAATDASIASQYAIAAANSAAQAAAAAAASGNATNASNDSGTSSTANDLGSSQSFNHEANNQAGNASTAATGAIAGTVAGSGGAGTGGLGTQGVTCPDCAKDSTVQALAAGSGKSFTAHTVDTFDNSLPVNALTQAKTDYDTQFQTIKTQIASMFTPISSGGSLPVFDYGIIKGVHVAADLTKYNTPLSYLGYAIMFAAAFISVQIFLG